MKILKIITYIGAAAIGTLGVIMAITNPNQSSYEVYAAGRLGEYLKSDVCTKAPKVFGEDLLRLNCRELVDSSKPAIRQIVTANTQRQNFIFLVFTPRICHSILLFLPITLKQWERCKNFIRI